MNILVTGSRGQLGSELQAIAGEYPEHTLWCYDLPDLDITDTPALEAVCNRHAIDAIVNCAAYTAVDRAEEEEQLAFQVNAAGPASIAEVARQRGALFMHVSTDYVFDGTSSIPYTEEATPRPLGVYGRSKWEGEEAIRRISPSYIIVRTSWLYSNYGSNFVKTMLRLGEERDRLNVVFDQVGTPTYARDLARAIMAIIDRVEPGRRYGATYHFSNEGVCSWYDFALMALRIAGRDCRVFPIESREYPTPTRRPHYSVLNKSAIKRDWQLEIPHWIESLEQMIAIEQQS